MKCDIYVLKILLWCSLRCVQQRLVTLRHVTVTLCCITLCSNILSRIYCTVHVSVEIETEMAGISSCDQAKGRQKLGLVWKIKKEISQIIKDLYFPFFLLIILWLSYSHHTLGPMVLWNPSRWGENYNKEKITAIRIFAVSQNGSQSVQKLKLVFIYLVFTYKFAQHKRIRPHT
jgi:hypothetical protein